MDGQELLALQENRTFYGGLQVFGASRVDNVIHVAGTFRTASDQTSWVWLANADTSPSSRGAVHTFPAAMQVVGPPALNQRTLMLFVPVHDHTDKSKRLIIYLIPMLSDGRVKGSPVANFYVQLYSQSAVASLAPAPPYIPGFAVRMDTGAVVAVDEQETRVHVFACASYVSGTSPASCDLARSPVVSTYYATAAYKDAEFIGRVPTAPLSDAPGLLATPAKFFLTTLEDDENSHATLFVQCAKCQGGGVTSTEKEASSEGECFCPAGYMIVREMGKPQRCALCSCKAGQYIDTQSGLEQCLTGRETSMPGKEYAACHENNLACLKDSVKHTHTHIRRVPPLFSHVQPAGRVYARLMQWEADAEWHALLPVHHQPSGQEQHAAVPCCSEEGSGHRVQSRITGIRVQKPLHICQGAGLHAQAGSDVPLRR
jgi:hypothetical protein